jgi:hypothetical protein
MVGDRTVGWLWIDFARVASSVKGEMFGADIQLLL